MSLFRENFALDLGSMNTRLANADGQILLQDRSTLVYRDRTPLAVGEEAISLFQREPGHLRLVNPILGGAVAAPTEACQMLRMFLQKAKGRHPMTGLVLVAVPACVTPVQRHALVQLVKEAGASRVWLEDAGWTTALGAGLPTAEASGSMVADIGAQVITSALYSMDGRAGSCSTQGGSSLCEQEITGFIREKYHCVLAENAAAELKCQLASVWEPAINDCLPTRSRDMDNGLPVTLNLTAQEMNSALEGWIQALADQIARTMAQAPAELVADVMRKGMVLTGGGSRLRGLDHRLEAALGVPVQRAEAPESANIRGCAMLLKRGLPYLQKKAGLWPGRQA